MGVHQTGQDGSPFDVDEPRAGPRRSADIVEGTERCHGTITECQRLNVIAARILYREMADEPGFAQVIDTGQAAIRGLALLSLVDAAEADAAWPAVRAHIMELSAEFIAEAEASC